MKSVWRGAARLVTGALVTAFVAACGGNPVGPTPAAALSAIALNPAVVAGTNVVGVTVTLSSGAPSAGARVALSSSDGAVAPVPPEIIIAGGQTSGTASFTTGQVTTSRSVTITASYRGVSQLATLQVTPP